MADPAVRRHRGGAPTARARPGRSTQILRALDGRFIAAGPSGSPLRGLVNVLPTGRNFYSVDPKAVPSRLAWETGVAMADSLLTRYREDNGDWPRSVGLSVWGTSAMRTSGDDIAEVLALLGVRPVWDDASRRVVDLEPIALAELGRPRIDVTVRISGFFRDAFPHVVTMLDDAVALVADLDEPAEQNYVRAHAEADLAEHGDRRRATTRIFGSKPGTYGAGLLQLIDSRNWRDDADLAEVYTAWGGFAYGRGLDGAPATDDMNRQYRRIAVAAKNTDTREHDIADSDDYFQYHGGMVATVRALTGKAPGGLHRRQHPARRGAHPHAVGGDHAGVPGPRGQPALDDRDAQARLQGRVRDGRHRRLPVRLRRHRACDGRLDVRAAHGRAYVLDDENRKFMAESNPWALHGMAERLLEAAGRGMWAAARRRPPSTGCARCCWRPKATSKAEPDYVGGHACHVCRRRQDRIHPADHVHQGRPAQADGHLGGAERRRAGGDHPGVSPGRSSASATPRG